MSNPRRIYSGLTVDDLPPPKPRATPTTAPAAIATMTMIFVVSLCRGRGAGAGALLTPGGALASGLAPTSGPAPLEGAVSTEGAGAPAAGVFAAGAFPRISLIGIWWISETDITFDAPSAAVVSKVLPVTSTDAPTRSSSPDPWSS